MRRHAAGALCALLVLAGCGGGGDPRRAPLRTPRPAGWAAPNADPSNTRWVGGPIDSATVARLRVAWRLPVGSYAATPIVRRGVVYLQDLTSTVYAVDQRSGRLRWKRAYRDPTIGPNGVAVVHGRVYGATETTAFALDARTGRQLWRRRIALHVGEGIDMAPAVGRGLVYLSTVPVTVEVAYAPGARGILCALDAATGRPRWRWATVPAGLWGKPRLNAGGGLWHPPALDGRGGLYAAIANPAPFAGPPETAWGVTRPGPNRWTDSLVKLDAASGRLAWGRQVLPHDVLDWDLQGPPILRRVGGRAIVIVAGKMGVVYAFDQASGAPLWRRPVGRHNGHDHDNLKAMRGQLRAFPDETRVLPGDYGGVETQMAADADTVYAPVNNEYTTVSGTTFLENQPLEDATGELVALDAASGDVRWERTLPSPAFGAATVVNDLVFTTTYDGTIWALRTDTGEVAWRARLPSKSTAPVAIAGDTLITAASPGYGAGGRVIAYRLR